MPTLIEKLKFIAPMVLQSCDDNSLYYKWISGSRFKTLMLKFSIHLTNLLNQIPIKKNQYSPSYRQDLIDGFRNIDNNPAFLMNLLNKSQMCAVLNLYQNHIGHLIDCHKDFIEFLKNIEIQKELIIALRDIRPLLINYFEREDHLGFDDVCHSVDYTPLIIFFDRLQGISAYNYEKYFPVPLGVPEDYLRLKQSIMSDFNNIQYFLAQPHLVKFVEYLSTHLTMLTNVYNKTSENVSAPCTPLLYSSSAQSRELLISDNEFPLDWDYSLDDDDEDDLKDDPPTPIIIINRKK